MTLVERFLKYVSFDTQSSEETEITPSTPGQMVFARYLKEELESLGLEEITLDEMVICSPLFLPIQTSRCPSSALLPTWIQAPI